MCYVQSVYSEVSLIIFKKPQTCEKIRSIRYTVKNWHSPKSTQWIQKIINLNAKRNPASRLPIHVNLKAVILPKDNIKLFTRHPSETN